MKVTVFGGSGFVGRALCASLLARGHRVRVVTRDAGRSPAGVEPHVGDPATEGCRRGALAGQDAAINLIGILHGNEAAMERAHVALPAAIAASCRESGVPVLLHMSALGADPGGPSRYLRSKGRGEDAAHAAAGKDLRVTSFRPSVIFGPGDDFTRRFARLLRLAPGVLLLPMPYARFAPVFVEDVARVMADALTDPTAAGRRLDLCGPTDYSLIELVRRIGELAGHRRLVLPMPNLLARAAADVMERLPNPPLTRDNLDSMTRPNVCPASCPRQATALEAVAAAYLRRG